MVASFDQPKRVLPHGHPLANRNMTSMEGVADSTESEWAELAQQAFGTSNRDVMVTLAAAASYSAPDIDNLAVLKWNGEECALVHGYNRDLSAAIAELRSADGTKITSGRKVGTTFIWTVHGLVDSARLCDAVFEHCSHIYAIETGHMWTGKGLRKKAKQQAMGGIQ